MRLPLRLNSDAGHSGSFRKRSRCVLPEIHDFVAVLSRIETGSDGNQAAVRAGCGV